MRSDFSRRNEDLKRRLGVEEGASGEDDNDAPSPPKRLRTMDSGEDMEISSGDEHQFRPPLPPGMLRGPFFCSHCLSCLSFAQILIDW